MSLNISQTVFNLLGSFNSISQSGWSIWPTSVVDSACTSLIGLSHLENTTILSASHVSGDSTISTPGSCQSTASSTVDMCRVYAVVNTTSDSSVKLEIWLPDTWYGRILTVGNGGLGGCITYEHLEYGTSLHFATVGSDNGHDGLGGAPFLDHPEVLNDFAHRSVHVATTIGRQIVQAYYRTAPSKSYFLGCSTGGRQGVQSALMYPDDYDGIVGGAPAVDFNHLMGWSGINTRYFGAPNGESSPSHIPSALWDVISKEILRQCDALDGVDNGIISEPDDCNFDPEALLCAKGQESGDGCLTRPQVDALHKFYQPLNGTDGREIYPRFDPGAEADPFAALALSGMFFPVTHDWMKYAIYNDSTLTFEEFGLSDIEYADTINPGGVATWNGNLSEFRNRGGKFLMFHGRRDGVVPSGISRKLHDLISSTLDQSIDDFYRLFLIPGLNHCVGGLGAWNFGQGSLLGYKTNTANDSDHNILLAMVDWVENGVAPSSITGVGDNERMHCMYPQKSVWSSAAWECVSP